MLPWWVRQIFRKRPTGPVQRTRSPKSQLRLVALEDRAVPAFLAPASSSNGIGYSPDTATGDFNGDGIADVVSIGSLSGRGVVSVSLGNGDGTFQAAQLSNSGNSSPLQIRVADFDGDGKQDVVTLGSYYIDTLTVLKGNGDGTFQAPTPYSYSVPPTEIEVADMNGDGHSDLIAGNHFFNTTSVMLNDGTGRLGPKVDSVGVVSPSDLATGDFNGDGKLDVVSTGMYGGVNVQLGNGNGTLQAPKSYGTAGTPAAATVGDFNGDGISDIAVANTASYAVGVLIGNGDGTFQAAANYNVGSAPLDVTQGDFNGDGFADLIERTGSGFAVELANGDGTFQAADQIAYGGGSSLIAADFNNDGVTDVAVTNAGSVGVSMNDSTPIINATNSAVNFVISAPTTSVAGAAVPVTVSAVAASGNVITDYAGTVRVFTNDPRAGGLGITYTFTPTDQGSHTFTSGVNLYTAGTQSVLVSAPLVGVASQSVTVTPGAATHFALTAPPTTAAGQPMTFTVTALDAYNNMGATYTGTLHFGSSDAQAVLPADYTFTAADAGIHAFTASLATVSTGGQKITAADTADATMTGTSPAVAVTPIDAVSFSLVGGGGHIGSAHAVTVVARDVYGNVATGYNGTVQLTASDPNMVLPPDGNLVNGVGTFSVTPMTLGTQTITATAVADPSLAGTETVTGTAGLAVKFVATPVPATTAGVAQAVTVKAYDAFGNVAVDYAGTVVFGSSDAQAGLPGFYAFTAADNGSHTFSVTLRTAGTQSLTVRDWSNASITTTQTGISVSAAAATSVSFTPLSGAVAGTAQTFTVTVRDAFGNVATG